MPKIIQKKRKGGSKKRKKSAPKVFRPATAKRALRAKTGMKRVSPGAVGTIDRRAQAYPSSLTSKIMALTGDKSTITASDVRYALGSMTEGPKKVFGISEAKDKTPFQKTLVSAFIRSKTRGKRWQKQAVSIVFTALTGWLDRFGLHTRRLHEFAKTKTITDTCIRVANDICK